MNESQKRVACRPSLVRHHRAYTIEGNRADDCEIDSLALGCFSERALSDQRTTAHTSGDDRLDSAIQSEVLDGGGQKRVRAAPTGCRLNSPSAHPVAKTALMATVALGIEGTDMVRV
jgi:hypothetical protein